MPKQTPLYPVHVSQGAKMVDFAGWDMPLHYGSQIDEHHHVRKHTGLFDVSHMGVVDIEGVQAPAYLRYLLANNVDRLVDGKAMYTCMLNDQGGVIDDLIVYKVSDDHFRVVINAGTREGDIVWMQKQQGSFDCKLTERQDLAMFAIQGPNTNQVMEQWLLPEQFEVISALKPFHFAEVDDCFIARTGYTGENGYEIILPASKIAEVWNKLCKFDAKPCGLGARDTLRLEAGLNLYGSDMDQATTPLESNLSWTVIMDPQDREFIGRKALEKQKQEGVKYRLVGLVLEGSGIMRNKMKVNFEGNGEGFITSGGYSPTLEQSIALARVPVESGDKCFVEIRKQPVPASIIKPPFVRQGKKMF